MPHRQDPRSSAAGRDRSSTSSVAHLVRIMVAAAVGLYFLFTALASNDPTAMLVGMLPIAWIAVESAWVALRPRREPAQR
ncbi:MAG: hypothetical protein WCA17_04055 [Burkholderiales bacterium]